MNNKKGYISAIQPHLPHLRQQLGKEQWTNFYHSSSRLLEAPSDPAIHRSQQFEQIAAQPGFLPLRELILKNNPELRARYLILQKLLEQISKQTFHTAFDVNDIAYSVAFRDYSTFESISPSPWKIEFDQDNNIVISPSGVLASDVLFPNIRFETSGALDSVEVVNLENIDWGRVEVLTTIDDDTITVHEPGELTSILKHTSELGYEELGSDDDVESEEELSTLETVLNEQAPRYVNINIRETSQPDKNWADQPLMIDLSYFLHLQIKREFDGIGSKSDATLSKVPSSLEFILRSDTVTFGDKKGKHYWDKIQVPLRCDSDPKVCSISFSETGIHYIDFDLFTQKGILLKDMRIKLRVVDNTIDIQAEENVSTHVRVSNLSLQANTGESLRDRKLTVMIEKSGLEHCATVISWRKDQKKFSTGTRISSKAVNEFRSKTTNFLEAMASDFQSFPNDAEIYEADYLRQSYERKAFEHIAKIAKHGKLVFEDLFSGEKPQIEPNSIVQMIPIDSGSMAPWNLLYEKPISTSPTHICPDYFEKPIGECSCGKDKNVVCPQAFWGYRYEVEQIPPYPNPVTLDRDNRELGYLILNLDGLTVLAGVHNDFERDAQVQLSQWQATYRDFTYNVAKSLDDLEMQLLGHGGVSAAQLGYFFVHGEEVDNIRVIQIGNDIPISQLDLINLKRVTHSPLIFLNGCKTANYDLAEYGNLIQAFIDIGTVGVIGSQCTIYPTQAGDYAMRLFSKLFENDATLGAAMNQTTRELFHLGNPFGLVYSIYGSADIKLVTSLEVKQDELT